jgi:hypothetical protein
MKMPPPSASTRMMTRSRMSMQLQSLLIGGRTLPSAGVSVADAHQLAAPCLVAESEAGIFASSEKRTAFPLVPIPLEHVNESPQDAAIVQFISDDMEPCADRAQRCPAVVTGHDLANAEHRRQEATLTANTPLTVKVVHPRT